ncbi:MAG: 2-amino-4-hydroxy-6-hydroxymethyldihydropteridine diphosphokinase [Candidatus Hatepunaea meridiana]|nr:2-amino-4-hydroxy-6-hydroxymethyldihydropteridine diphosphokinase [Candidatus Hatepunaea meridiana]
MGETKTTYISAGSNLGDRKEHLTIAIDKLSKTPDIEVVNVSSLYETEPWGMKDQPDFLNCVIKIKTTSAPERLLIVLKAIEKSIGRKESNERWGQREIDLDIIIYGCEVIDSPELTIPHPRLAERCFVLEPLSDLCPDLVVPGLDLSVKHILKGCSDSRSVKLNNKDWLF